MWFPLVFVVVAHTELLLLLISLSSHAKIQRRPQGEERLILRGEQDPCHGHVEIFYKSKWGFVGDQDWSGATEEVACRSAGCGPPEGGATEDVLMPLGGKVWLNEVKCNGSENHLFDCEYPGQGISFYRKETVKKIKCSNKIIISLDGFKCAGAVRFSVNQTQPGYFCAGTWGEKEADLLCRSLNCGKSKETSAHDWMIWKDFKKSEKKKLDCGDVQPLDNLWQCVSQEATECKQPASVVCTGYERLQLRGNEASVCSGQLEKEEDGNWVPLKSSENSPDVWCRQMNCGSSLSHSRSDSGTRLACSDVVRVVLMDGDKPSGCYGAVHVSVNGDARSVCASAWTRTEAEVTCRELNCGKVITYEKRLTGRGIMDNVRCLGGESSLWHCRATRDRDMKCSTAAYVVCAGSLDVRLTDAPGKCAGRVEILYEGGWKQVSADRWTDDNSDAVCRHIDCGRSLKSAGPEQQFGRSSADFLTRTLNCRKNASVISECFTQTSEEASWTEAVRLTCDQHKVLILKGDSNPCSGSVGIMNGDATYWLSGSKTTWTRESADAVCRQVHCGKASDFPSVAAAGVQTDVWEEAYNCSADAASLFDCDVATKSRDHDLTRARVTCSGTIAVNVTDWCWGTVSVCLDEHCGGVCADSWTHTHSAMLCQSLGCGDVVPFTESPYTQNLAMVKSLYLMKNATSLSHSVVAMNDQRHACSLAYVVCSGSVKPRFSITRDKCSGNLEVFSEGQWLPVCADALRQKQAQHTVCEELQCGRAVATIDYFGPKPKTGRVISNVQCSETGVKSISACNISYSHTQCSPVGLHCTDWRKIKVIDDSCRGAVYVHSSEGRSAVAIDGWTETEGQRLCQDLNCGRFKSKKVCNTSQQLPWNGSFSCGKDPENIWDCEKPASSSQREQLFVECEDEPVVTLSEGCSGIVKINGMKACYSQWHMDYSHLVCQEHKCSNAVANFSLGFDPKVDYYHVRCDDFHSKLGQCARVQGKCDSGPVFVNCVGSSGHWFNTTGHCGGMLSINYRNDWEKMCPLNLSTAFMDQLCQKMSCGGHDDSLHIRDVSGLADVETALDCNEYHNDINYCVTQRSCKGVRPARIYCKGYKATSDNNAHHRHSGGIAPIILAVGLCLALIIVIALFIRICVVKKVKNFCKIPERKVSRTEIPFESGDYEEVSKNHDVEDFRFRSEAEVEVVAESDAHSVTSFSYDDVDEAVEAQPLTIRRTRDTVAFEAGDSLDNYDDIGAPPEVVAQTTAEVHHSPDASGVGGAAAAPGSVQQQEEEEEEEDGDYVLPGDDEG